MKNSMIICTCIIGTILSSGIPKDTSNTCSQVVYNEVEYPVIEIKKDNKVYDKYNEEAIISTKKINENMLKDISWEVKNQEESNKKIFMKTDEEYTKLEGVTCFRGNNYRNAPSYGVAHISEKKLEIKWSKNIGNTDRWTGVGWNGQPAIVKWPKDLKKRMNIYDDKKEKKDLTEVLYATLDRKVYFLDLENGDETRDKIIIPGPVKGSLTVDPRGVPLLYVGQGINKVNGKRVQMGYRIFSLLDNKKLYFINGYDSFAYRKWSAFDSTALIDKNSDTMLVCGENGLFYKVLLNTKYDETGISIDPKVSKLRYKVKNKYYQGIENSVAVYKNLGYFADNSGSILCIDINSLNPVWIFDGIDDIDSTIVIDLEKKDYMDNVSVYTASEVDKQGSNGYSYIRKIDGLCGNLIWEKTYPCRSIIGENPVNGGVLATPIVGKNSIEGMIIYNIARYESLNKGLLVALDKKSGEEIWKIKLDNYSWSSPVDIYDNEGNAYIVLCDSVGKMFLIEASTGVILDTILLGSNVEGSPAVFNDMIVVGTRGQKIYGIRIK